MQIDKKEIHNWKTRIWNRGIGVDYWWW